MGNSVSHISVLQALNTHKKQRDTVQSAKLLGNVIFSSLKCTEPRRCVRNGFFIVTCRIVWRSYWLHMNSYKFIWTFPIFQQKRARTNERTEERMRTFSPMSLTKNDPTSQQVMQRRNADRTDVVDSPFDFFKKCPFCRSQSPFWKSRIHICMSQSFIPPARPRDTI